MNEKVIFFIAGYSNNSFMFMDELQRSLNLYKITTISTFLDNDNQSIIDDIKRYQDKELYLIGHASGANFILNIFQKYNFNIKKVYLIDPLLCESEMTASLISWIKYLLIICGYVLNYLPVNKQSLMSKMHNEGYSVTSIDNLNGIIDFEKIKFIFSDKDDLDNLKGFYKIQLDDILDRRLIKDIDIKETKDPDFGDWIIV